MFFQRVAKCPVSNISTLSPGERVLTSPASQAPVPDEAKITTGFCRLEDPLAAREHLQGQGLELRPPVIDGGFGQGPEHLLGDIRRPRDL